ncbi:UNVERIFIED_CONTAM: hypothetical protein K2H54_062907 [Gekko kuhli]
MNIYSDWGGARCGSRKASPPSLPRCLAYLLTTVRVQGPRGDESAHPPASERVRGAGGGSEGQGLSGGAGRPGQLSSTLSSTVAVAQQLALRAMARVGEAGEPGCVSCWQ